MILFCVGESKTVRTRYFQASAEDECASSDCIETIEPHGDSNRLYGGTEMRSNTNGDLEAIPMAYFWYPFLAIVGMVIAAVAVVIKMI